MNKQNTLSELNETIVAKQPSFDRHGYPTDETLDLITNWPIGDIASLTPFVLMAWSDYGRTWIEKGELHLATGGWSGNESIIHALQQNYVVWAQLWKSSHRGGKFVFAIL